MARRMVEWHYKAILMPETLYCGGLARYDHSVSHAWETTHDSEFSVTLASNHR